MAYSSAAVGVGEGEGDGDESASEAFLDDAFLLVADVFFKVALSSMPVALFFVFDALLEVVVVIVSSFLVVQEVRNARPNRSVMEVRRNFFIGVWLTSRDWPAATKRQVIVRAARSQFSRAGRTESIRLSAHA